MRDSDKQDPQRFNKPSRLLLVALFILLLMAASFAVSWLFYSSDIISEHESALEHSAKHLDVDYQCPMHPDVIRGEPGSCPICGMDLVPLKSEMEDPQMSADQASTEKEILYWVAPMDASYRRDQPGKSPMGMDLVPVYAEDNQATGNEVRISPEVEQHLGVRTQIVESGKLWRKITTVGYVSLDESRVSHIHLRVDGWIENLSVNAEGDRVKKGQRLFDVYSPELVNAMAEYVQSLRSTNQRLSDSAQGKLRALGVSEAQIKRLASSRRVPQTISIYAPQDGVVSMLNVREGMYLQPQRQVMTLADLSSVWVLADVFEGQSDWVEKQQSAEVSLIYKPGKIWQGKVEHIYPLLNEATRSLQVRLQFDNPDEQLKPNMYANVVIYAGAVDNVLSVPREAVIRSGNQQRLIIKTAEGRYQPRQVVTGLESGDWIEIRSGVQAGERVVTSAQFLIDSEAGLKASLNRMQSPAEQMKDEQAAETVQ
jgi:Cu(I)/Ag(I) efflux system membrane fusion protein